MAEIGRADLLIVPRFDNLTKSVESALGKCEGQASKSGSSLGKSTGSGFGKGLAGSGAMIGAFSTLTSKAMDSISSHVGSAISRFDTLNNYPKVMQSLPQCQVMNSKKTSTIQRKTSFMVSAYFVFDSFSCDTFNLGCKKAGDLFGSPA